MDASSPAAVRTSAPAPIPFPNSARLDAALQARLHADNKRAAQQQRAASEAERTKLLLNEAYTSGMHTGQRTGWFNGLRDGFWLGAAAATVTVGPLVGFFVWLGVRP